MVKYLPKLSLIFSFISLVSGLANVSRVQDRFYLFFVSVEAYLAWLLLKPFVFLVFINLGGLLLLYTVPVRERVCVSCYFFILFLKYCSIYLFS